MTNNVCDYGLVCIINTNYGYINLIESISDLVYTDFQSTDIRQPLD